MLHEAAMMHAAASGGVKADLAALQDKLVAGGLG